MLDTRLSSLLRMRVNGAIDASGTLYTTTNLITVNYPWVVTQIGTNCVHLYPWLKDTEIEEGLDLYSLLPDDYNSGAKWFRRYLFMDEDLLTLDWESDSPSVLFPKFILNSLMKNHPGVSIDDIGVKVRDRKHDYSRWEDFPTPNVVNDPLRTVVVDSLTSSAITNVSAGMTNLFNTVVVELSNSGDTNLFVSTGPLRMVDLHNRKFLLMTNSGYLNLWLAPFVPGYTNQSDFGPSDPGLTNIQVLGLPLGVESNFVLTVTHYRHRAINPGAVPTGNYLGVYEQLVTSESDSLDWVHGRENPVFGTNWFLNLRPVATSLKRKVKGNELAALCFNVGRVTARMVNVHALSYWQEQQKKDADSHYKPAPRRWRACRWRRRRCRAGLRPAGRSEPGALRRPG